jgi:hypothetical protein
MTPAPFDDNDNIVAQLLSSLNRVLPATTSSVAVSDVLQHDIHPNDATGHYTDAVNIRVLNDIQPNNEVSMT